MSTQKLRRNLTFLQMIAIGGGAVIGGWLAEAPYWFGLTGAGSAFVFPVLAILLIPVGLAFSELCAMLPFASGVDVWTCNAFGHKAGWAAQWMMFLIQVVEPPMMAFIFLTALNFFVPIPPEHMKFAAMAVMFLWYILSNFDIKLTGMLANIFFYCMITISLIVALCFFTSGHWTVSNITDHGGWLPQGGYGIFIAMAVLSLKFIGFELTPTLIEEFNFPAKKIWMVILSSLFVPAILYCIVVLALGGVAPWTELSQMSMPEPELIVKFGMPRIIAIAAIFAGILHALTTIMSFWVSSARVLYGAAQLNQLPHKFKEVNKHGQPWFSNIVVLAFALFFCLFTGSNWVQYLYAVSCIAAGLVYGMACIDCIVLRKKFPEWERPYRAPGGTGFMIIGVALSVWLVIGSCLELSLGGYMSLLAYCVAGYALFAVMESYRKKNPKTPQLVTLTPADINKVE